MACPLRSAGITPLQHYKETALSAGTALGGQVFGRQWFIASMFHSLWVGKAGGELLQRNGPLRGHCIRWPSVWAAMVYRLDVSFAVGRQSRWRTTMEQSEPDRCIGTFSLADLAACAFSLNIANQGLKFRTRARIRVTPPTHRTPHGQ